MIVKESMNPEKEKQLDKLKDEYIEVQNIVSELRKKGMDTRVAELLLMEIPSKIKMAQITQEDNDIKLAKKAMQDIRKESKEVNQGSDFEHIHTLIEEAFDFVRNGEKAKAVEKYNEIMSIYRLLTKDLKQTVYSSCVKLREKLK